MSWTTPADLRAEVQRLWDSGRLLAGIVDEVAAKAGPACPRTAAGTASEDADNESRKAEAAARHPKPIEFPLGLRFRRPKPQELSTRYEEVQAWIRQLEAASREAVGAGYDISWEEVKNRVLGCNVIPKTVFVPTRADALAMIGASEAARSFEAIVAATIGGFPELCDWLRRKPHAALAEVEAWDRILAVLTWFRAHPRSGLYVRQVDVPGVHTKFIEGLRSLLSELLDIVLAPEAIDQAHSAFQFEARYGLAARPALVRFRILDPTLAIAGLTDFTVRIHELARNPLPAERIFIVENEITGLAFPHYPRSAVAFGGGYAIERLSALPWLRDRDVYYWGDIDTHGLAILDRLRAFLPEARSLLMDRATLLAHPSLWSFEDTPLTNALPRLKPDEAALYDDLRFDRLGRGVRLEQERIPFGVVSHALTSGERQC